jgi:hypothetical protein
MACRAAAHALHQGHRRRAHATALLRAQDVLRGCAGFGRAALAMALTHAPDPPVVDLLRGGLSQQMTFHPGSSYSVEKYASAAIGGAMPNHAASVHPPCA